MAGKSIKKIIIGHNKDFNYRGETQTRLETLSDAVFAIAIALLVLSSSVPERFDDLLISLEDIVPFAVCITLLMLVWYQHYTFFIRYGLQDAKTVFMNTILLFLILFYVYPLKFLFKVLYKLVIVLITQDEVLYRNLITEVLRPNQGPDLMIIYGIGASAIFLTLSMMYWYALKLKNDLALSDKEVFDTTTSIRINLIMGLVPILSILIAWIQVGGARWAFSLSGFAYWLYMVLMPWYSSRRKKKRKKLFS